LTNYGEKLIERIVRVDSKRSAMKIF
jgi:hypothetical protein